MASVEITATEIVSGLSSVSFLGSKSLTLSNQMIKSDSGATVAYAGSLLKTSMLVENTAIVADDGVIYVPNREAADLDITGSILGYVPNAPTDVNGEPDDGSAIISFTPSTASNGSDIVEYKVTSTPGNIVAYGTESPITVTGLTNDVSYTFVVQAINETGIGAASAPSAIVVPNLPFRVNDLTGVGSEYTAGSTISFTVALNTAVTSNITLQLSSNHPEVFNSFPSTLTVLNGQWTTSTSLTVASSFVGNKRVTITARFGTSTATATTSILTGKISDIYFYPDAKTAFYSNDNIIVTVIFDRSMSTAGGISLSFSNLALLQGTIPTSATFLANATIVEIPVKAAFYVTGVNALNVTASFGDSVVTRMITIAPAYITRVTYPALVGSGFYQPNSSITVNVSVDRNVPYNTNFVITTNRTAIFTSSLPLTVTIPSGSNTGSFTLDFVANASLNYNSNTLTLTYGTYTNVKTFDFRLCTTMTVTPDHGYRTPYSVVTDYVWSDPLVLSFKTDVVLTMPLTVSFSNPNPNVSWNIFATTNDPAQTVSNDTFPSSIVIPSGSDEFVLTKYFMYLIPNYSRQIYIDYSNNAGASSDRSTLALAVSG